MTFISHRKLQQNKYTATMVSAASRQVIGAGGAPINKSRRRRPQIVGGGGARLYFVAQSWGRPARNLAGQFNIRHNWRTAVV